MAKQEQLQFFCIFKKEKIDFQTLLEKVFIEFIQEKENKKKSSKSWNTRKFQKYSQIFFEICKIKKKWYNII